MPVNKKIVNTCKTWILHSVYKGFSSLINNHVFNGKAVTECDIRKVCSELEKKGYLYKDPFTRKLDLQTDNKYELSLLVPVYNNEKYLAECLNSLIGQKTGHTYQIVIVNDGSTDKSAAIIERYKGISNIAVFEQSNRGISAARNKALELASGKYIGFIDNDDIVSKHYVEHLINRITQTDADIVKCGHRTISDGRIVETSKLTDASYPGGLGSNIVKYNGYIWGGCYRRSLWNDICFPEGFWFEDMITRLLPYSICKKFEYLGEALYYKRDHETNASKVVWNRGIKRFDQLFLLRSIIRKRKDIQIPMTESHFGICMEELGCFACSRLGIKDLYNSFVISADIVKEMRAELGHEPEFSDGSTWFLYESLKNGDYDAYRLWMIREKIKILMI